MDIKNLEELLKEIKQEQKEQNSKLEDIRVNVSENTVDLRHHIKRTELAEKRLELIDHKVSVAEVQIAQATSKLKGAGILVGFILSAISTIAGIIIFFK